MAEQRTPNDDHITNEASLIRDAVASIVGTRDAQERAIKAGQLLNVLNDAVLETKTTRFLAIKKLNEEGVSYTSLSEILGISKTRVQQILTQTPPTRRWGKVETEASRQAEALRSEGKSDTEIAAAVIPNIISIRSAERYTPSQIAEMLNVPTSIVQAPWSAAKKAKMRDIKTRRPQ